MGRKHIIPDVIIKSLPEHNSVGTVFVEIFSQRKIFLIIAVTSAAKGEHLVPRIKLTKIIFKKLLRHPLGWARRCLNLRITEQNNYNVAIRISDWLSPVAQLIEKSVRIRRLPAGAKFNVPRWPVQQPKTNLDPNKRQHAAGNNEKRIRECRFT